MLILCRHLVLVALFSPFLWNSSIFLAQFAPFDRCCYGFNFNIFLTFNILTGSLNINFTCNNCKLNTANFQGSPLVDGSNITVVGFPFAAAFFISGHGFAKSDKTLRQEWVACGKIATSFPGPLILLPGASEERPWLGLVTCLSEPGRLQLIYWREERLGKNFVHAESTGVRDVVTKANHVSRVSKVYSMCGSTCAWQNSICFFAYDEFTIVTPQIFSHTSIQCDLPEPLEICQTTSMQEKAAQAGKYISNHSRIGLLFGYLWNNFGVTKWAN